MFSQLQWSTVKHNLIEQASIPYVVKRLTVKTREVPKQWSEIWQASCQRCSWSAYQFHRNLESLNPNPSASKLHEILR